MTAALDRVLSDSPLARALAADGLSTILARHTCAHRVDELLATVRELEQEENRVRPSALSPI
jgi:hypothetical protein